MSRGQENGKGNWVVTAKGQKWVNRFLRRRGLALCLMFALFAGWILLAGFLLWEAKVKMEYACLGKLDLSEAPPPSEGWGLNPVRLRVVQGLGQDLLASLRPGDEVVLRIEAQRGQDTSFRTHLVALEREEGHPILLLTPTRDLKEGALEAYRTDHGEPVRLRVGFRNRRLLQVAFERSPLPR